MCFFFNDTATTEIYTLSLHDALPICRIYQKWKQKADQFGFECSEYLEKHATNEQKADGVDIADFLIKKYSYDTATV